MLSMLYIYLYIYIHIHVDTQVSDGLWEEFGPWLLAPPVRASGLLTIVHVDSGWAGCLLQSRANAVSASLCLSSALRNKRTRQLATWPGGLILRGGPGGGKARISPVMAFPFSPRDLEQ